jgi:hypothetical protein
MGSRLVVTSGKRQREWSQALNWGDKNVLELDSGDGCMKLGMH